MTLHRTQFQLSLKPSKEKVPRSRLPLVACFSQTWKEGTAHVWMPITVAPAAITQCVLWTLNNAEWRTHPVFILCPLFSCAPQLKVLQQRVVASGFRESFPPRWYNKKLQPPDPNQQRRIHSLSISWSYSWKIISIRKAWKHTSKGEGKNGMFSCFLALDIFKLVYILNLRSTVSLQGKNTSLLIWFLLWHLSCSRLCNFY